MHLWLLILGTIGLCLIIVAVLGWFLWKPAVNFWVDSFLRRLLKDPYPENITEMYNVFRKVGVQNVLEADIRGATGEPLKRPFGTSNHYSKWEYLLLNPVYFSRKPVVESIEVQTKVTIGPQAQRPLTIDMPIMIAGMSWGVGLSSKAVLALARGADKAKTAMNTGASPCFPDVRKQVQKLIIQYHRGEWGTEEQWLRQADAIEIQLGYGALASTPFVVRPQEMGAQFREHLCLSREEKLSVNNVVSNLGNEMELQKIVPYLKKLTGGVPIGVKIGATHHLEEELEAITKADIDFLTIDGKEAGIHFGSGILEDDVGLPTLPALCRTVAFLQQKKLKSKISLVVSGGLFTPGQFLKALALGANAVYIGTIVLVALAHNQVAKILPWEPLSQLIYEKGSMKEKLSIDQGAINVANFLKSCNEEIILAMRSLGKTSLAQLTMEDLCAITPEISQITGAELAFSKPRS
jgi:glutamate synthase domain-containing protein 2